MKKALILLVAIKLGFAFFCYGQIELSEPVPEDTKRITAIIQYTSSFRFGDDLKLGEKVVYQVNNVDNPEDYSEHSLEVISRNDSTTIVLELFEGNELYVEFRNISKKVTAIWGKDILGGNHILTLLTENELQEIEKTKEQKVPKKLKLSNWKVSSELIDYQLNDSNISCKKIEIDNINGELSAEMVDILNQEEKMIMSDEIPKMLPLVPVAFVNISKKDALKNTNSGFVQNNNLTLKNFIKN